MALARCPDCRKRVSPSALACPKCGCPIAGNPDVRKPISPVVGVLILLGGLGTCCVTSFLGTQQGSTKPSPPSAPVPDGFDPDWRSKDNSITAYSQVKEFVKNELKSPSTASFPGLFERGDHTKYLGLQRYHVVSWVDAQNGFGGTIRNDFVADVEQVSATEWKCNSLEITPR